jgi:hypothetical protein
VCLYLYFLCSFSLPFQISKAARRAIKAHMEAMVNGPAPLVACNRYLAAAIVLHSPLVIPGSCLPDLCEFRLNLRIWEYL